MDSRAGCPPTILVSTTRGRLLNMPAPSWNSPGPIFLDRDRVIEEFKSLANAAAIHDARILRVVLFGSLATGRATPRSDADIMIELSHHPVRSIERIGEYLDAFIKGP